MGLLLLFILVASSRSVECFDSFNLSEPSAVRNNLVECLLKIISDPNLNVILNIQIRVEAEKMCTKREFMSSINEYSASNDKIAVYLDSDEYTHGRIYFVESSKSFRTIIEHQREYDNDFSSDRQYYLIVLPFEVPNQNDILREIFSFCWKKSILNVNVLVTEEDGTITLYTYFPFTQQSCKDLKPKIYNRFISGNFESVKPIFPSKISNLWQCPVRAIIYNAPPYILFHKDQLYGLDLIPFLILAKVMNISIEVIISPNGRGQVSLNLSLTGSYKMLDDGLGDFVTAACTVRNNRVFAASNAFWISNLCVIVKRPEAYGPLEILLFPFDCYTWSVIFLLFIGKWICQGHLRRYSNGLPNFMRLCSMPWLFSVLVLSSSYGGSIFDFLQNNPRAVPPTSLDEAIARNYKFVATPYYRDFLGHLTELTNNMVTFDGTDPETFAFFEQLGQRYAYVNWYEYLLEYVNGSTMNEEYFIIREPVFFQSVCLYLGKYSHLTDEFNKHFQHMIEHGHILKEYEMYMSETRDQIRKKKITGKDSESLPMEKLMGAFQLLFIMTGISSCVFAVELFLKGRRALMT